jgi:hypothetical protein
MTYWIDTDVDAQEDAWKLECANTLRIYGNSAQPRIYDTLPRISTNNLHE